MRNINFQFTSSLSISSKAQPACKLLYILVIPSGKLPLVISVGWTINNFWLNWLADFALAIIDSLAITYYRTRNSSPMIWNEAFLSSAETVVNLPWLVYLFIVCPHCLVDFVSIQTWNCSFRTFISDENSTYCPLTLNGWVWETFD